MVQPVLAQFRVSVIQNQCCQTINWADTRGFTLLNTSARSKTPQSNHEFLWLPLSRLDLQWKLDRLGRAGPAGSSLASQKLGSKPLEGFLVRALALG